MSTPMTLGHEDSGLLGQRRGYINDHWAMKTVVYWARGVVILMIIGP